MSKKDGYRNEKSLPGEHELNRKNISDHKVMPKEKETEVRLRKNILCLG